MRQNRNDLPPNVGFWERYGMVGVVSLHILCMKSGILLQTARQLLQTETIETPDWRHVFSKGGFWMFIWLQRLQFRQERVVPDATRLTYYGLLKYGICLASCFVACLVFFHLHFWRLPFSIILFYILEIQALFLFPLLIDRVPYPIMTSVKLTYSIGYFRVLFTVMMIGIFMVSGLLNKKNPLKNWYIGCLAVVIWYVEITDMHRISK